MKTRAYLALTTLFALCLSSTIAATKADIDPVATQHALNALLSASNIPIPRNSSCYGNYGQTGQAKVKDLLGMQLAYLYRGDNVIKGGCAGQKCTLTVTHAFGEDVSSAEIRFQLKAEKVRIESLACVFTP